MRDHPTERPSASRGDAETRSSVRTPRVRPSLFRSARLAAMGGVALVLGSASVAAMQVPLPVPHPMRGAPSSAPAAAAAPAITETAYAPVTEPGPALSMPSGVASGDLSAALVAATRGDGRTAYSIRNGLPSSLDKRIVDWTLIRTDNPVMTSSAISAFAREAPGWMSPEMVRDRAEAALLRENPPTADVLRMFASSPPTSVDGARLYARALVASGDRGKAQAVIRRVWLTEKMTDPQQDAILGEFGGLLGAADHRYRIEVLLYAERTKQAEKLKPLVGAGERAYIDARIAAVRKAKDLNARMAAVPANLRSLPGYKFIQAQALRRADRNEEAAQVLLSVPRDQAALVEPDAWWIERRLVSRELLDKGDAVTAYKLAATHSATGNQQRMDAEFHAGWYALRFLKDPSRAMAHFKRLDEIATTPISRARAEYWMGRAAEASGSSGSSYYKQAAAYGMTYYGQLARAKLGQSAAGVGGVPRPSGSDQAAFNGNDAVKALKRLISAGEVDRAWPLFDYLSETLPTAGQIVLLSELAERSGKNHFALLVAKEGLNRGLPVGGLAFPTAGIPKATRMPSGIERPLVYAIARQESTFNPGAVSAVGARGLMQFMPATAQATAKKAGVAYSAAKLHDPTYNASLGAYHLDELVTKFDGSYVLTFVAYNAGPRRSSEWVAKYGDPRDPSVDAVDWVERIPFSETRNYVQRVMENVQVYRERLGTGRLAIDRDLRRVTNG